MDCQPEAYAPSASVQTVGELVQAASCHVRNVENLNADIPVVRAAMLRSIEAYQQAIIEIKTGLNTLTPIGRLPREVLAIIMTMVARDYFDGRYDLMNRHPLHWVKVATHVCRTWRLLAFDTPALWAHIAFDMETKHFVDFIARSKKAPLFVKTFVARYGDHFNVVKKAIDALGQESGRLQELHFRGPTRFLQALCTRLQLPARHLRTLVLDAVDGREINTGRTASGCQTLIALPGSLPNLRHLEITNHSVRWNDAIFSNPSITSLTVTTFLDREGRTRNAQPKLGTFEQLLLALELLAPSLHSLTLEETIPRSTAKITELSESSARTLSFPSLRSVRLVGDAVDCARLLRHMSFPSIGRINIHTYGCDGVQEIVQRLSEDFARMEPWRAAELSSRPHTGLDLTAWAGEETYYEQQTAQLVFDVSSGMPTPLPAVCSQLAIWFRSLRRLSLTGSYGMMDWREFFTALPQLQELYLDSNPPQGFFDALRPRSRPHAKPSEILLPHLRSIELEYIIFHPRPYQRRAAMTNNVDVEFFPAFLKVLKSRASADLPLAELHMNTCVRVQAADIKALKEIVADVKWDAQEDMDGPSGDSLSDSDDDVYDSEGMSIHRYTVDYIGTDSEEAEDSDEEELNEEELAATIPVWVT